MAAPLRRAARRRSDHGVATDAGRRGARRPPTGTTTWRCWRARSCPATVDVLGASTASSRSARRSPYVELRRAAAPVRLRRARRRRHARPRRGPGRRGCGAGDLVVLVGRAGRRQDHVHPGSRRRAGRARRRHLADVRDRPGAPVAGGRAGPGARRRLPPRRHRRARRPRPRHLARRGRHRRRVGRGHRRGAGRRPARGTDRARRRRPGPRRPRRLDPRTVTLVPVGARWLGLHWPGPDRWSSGVETS